MPPALYYQISKLIFMLVDRLCPISGVFVAMNPAFIVFSFNHKYAICGYYKMINLATSSVCL